MRLANPDAFPFRGFLTDFRFDGVTPPSKQQQMAPSIYAI
jgi:hypothetical protein